MKGLLFYPVLFTFWILCHYSLLSDASSSIDKVHVVFMNHLDVGFKDDHDNQVGLVSHVLNRYFTEYFPRAIKLESDLRKAGHKEKFIYTTQPFLVSLYLHCPDLTLLNTTVKCPSPIELEIFRSAVRNGTIAWHAGPMNMQTDNMGLLTFNSAIEVSKNLDKEFGITRTHSTISQRDVPGLTKAVLRPLMKAGVKAISVGVNVGTSPPAVPCPFVWKFDKHQDGIMGFWIKGGYPLNPGPDPSHPGGLTRDKCITADGLSEALCFSFRDDNTGPPESIQEVLMSYEIVRSEFPGATVFASVMDNFVKSLETVKSTLPVVTSEMGDTWIQGIASDPKKTAMYRAFVREFEKCYYSGQCKTTDIRITEMTRFLIKIPEHTWGTHFFLDEYSYSNAQLEAARKTIDFRTTEQSWLEQREFIQLALTTLKDHPLKVNVTKAFDELTAQLPDLRDYEVIPYSGKQFKCEDGVVIEFSPTGGGISRLYDPYNKIEWAGPDSLLSQMTYNTYTEEDFTRMAEEYNYVANVGFNKYGASEAKPEHKQWLAKTVKAYQKKDSSCDFYLEVTFQDKQTFMKYGAPQVSYINYVYNPSLPGLDVTALLLNKTTTRLPESISLNFKPQPMKHLNLTVDKMGQTIDPCDVVQNGSQYLHAIDTGVEFSLGGSSGGLQILSDDAPLVQIGTDSHDPSPFPVPLYPLNCYSINSISYNFHNNIWNTNYIFWYPYVAEDADMKARFQIKFNKK